jgi:hypothetical protein
MEDDNTIMAVDPPIGAQLTQPLSSPLVVHSLRFLLARSKGAKRPDNVDVPSHTVLMIK